MATPSTTSQRKVPTVDNGVKHSQNRAEIILSNFKRSMNWMKDGFYAEWEQVYDNYLCVAPPVEDPYSDQPLPESNTSLVLDNTGRPYQKPGKLDRQLTSISTPDTWSLERRRAARATAQLPNLRYKAPEQDLADRVSRTLMYQWDTKVQPSQKRHVMQADMFGISVRGWSYLTDRQYRTRTINPLKMKPEQEAMVRQYFGQEIAEIAARLGVPADAPDPRIFVELLNTYGNGSRLRVKNEVLAYVGPVADFIFVGDCFFEPMFESLQTSAWFIVERRRSKRWLDQLVEAYPDTNAGKYVENLVKSQPHGTPYWMRTEGASDVKNLRQKLASIAGQNTRESDDNNTDPDAARWTILEIHYTGDNARVEYLCGSEWLGSYDQPNDLNGKIPFTSLSFHESLLHGIGDTDARVIRRLQDLRSRIVCQRADMADAMLRPLVGTDSQALMDDPTLVKRMRGMRLVKLEHQGAMWSIQDQAALSSVATSYNEEGAVSRLVQQATNESNMSNSADVDPKQGSTATGARIMARNQDILTRDMLNQLNAGIRQDVTMMYELNRTEMSEDFTFDGAGYRRFTSLPAGNPQQEASQTQSQPPVGNPGQPAGSPTQLPAGQPGVPVQDNVTVTPEDFQGDYQIEPEVGSTLAEDDEDNLNRATVLFQVAGGRPDLFNQIKARNQLLIAYKQGHVLNEWEPAPPPQPPPGVPAKLSLSVSLDPAKMTAGTQAALERLVTASATAQGADSVQSPTPDDVSGAHLTRALTQGMGGAGMGDMDDAMEEGPFVE